MGQSEQSQKILLSVIGVAILVVAVVGVSFAFFTYTRIGNPGTIKFNSTQSQNSISNVFPVSKNEALDTTSKEHMNVTYSEVVISGNTNSNAGLDFRVTAHDVDFKGIPVSVVVEHVTAGSTLKTVENKELATSGNSIYVRNYEDGVLSNGDELAVGHINANTKISGEKIIIRAYLDDSAILIADVAEDENLADLGDKIAITTNTWSNLANAPATFNISVEYREAGSDGYTN